jgi:glycerate 2-kinase
LDAYQAALTAVHGRARVSSALTARPLPGPVYLVALGKAACAMAQGAADVLGTAIADGYVVTKDGHADPLPWPVRAAGHPLPDARSLAAGEGLREFAARLPKAAKVLVLLSGGASALVEALPDGIGLDDLRALNAELLASGRDIAACNAARRAWSLIKGGRLAGWFAPRPVRVLAISDVRGDDPAVIASGPLTLPRDAGDIAALPADWRGLGARVTPPDPAWFDTVDYEIVATLDDAKRAAALVLQRDWPVVLHPEFVAGDALDAGRRLARVLIEAEPGGVHIWGGETTVVLPPRPGQGGRNQSLALAAAIALAGAGRIALLAAGTDGSDGPTDDAGALVDGGTLERGELAGLDAAAALAAADAGRFLAASGDLIHTGPTGTNVMDLMLGLRL